MKSNEKVNKQIEQTQMSIQVANRLITLAMGMHDKETALMHAEAKGQMLMTCLVLQWVADDETELDLLPYVGSHIKEYSEKYSLEKFHQDMSGDIGSLFKAMGFEEISKEELDKKVDADTSVEDQIIDFKKLISRKVKEANTNLN